MACDTPRWPECTVSAVRGEPPVTHRCSRCGGTFWLDDDGDWRCLLCGRVSYYYEFLRWERAGREESDALPEDQEARRAA